MSSASAIAERSVIPLSGRWRRTVVLVLLILTLLELPLLLVRTAGANRRAAGLVPYEGDSKSYHELAINLLHGHGFARGYILPLEAYRLDLSPERGQELAGYIASHGPDAPRYEFFRAPGWPLLLAGAYAVLGTEPVVARYLQVALAWAAALLLVALGYQWGSVVGACLGWLTGAAFLHGESTAVGWFLGGMVLTEIAATFWLLLFCAFFSLYWRRRGLAWLAGSGVALAALALTRGSLLTASPLVLLAVVLRAPGGRRGSPAWRLRLVHGALLTAVVGAPVLAWSAYASVTMGEPVLLSTQGGQVFYQYNNIDVLSGTGNKHQGPGFWQPGEIVEIDERGVVRRSRTASSGETTWAQGLAFWRENPYDLPRLFYLKLRSGFWYNGGDARSAYRSEGVHLLGIGFLLAWLGSALARGVRCPSGEDAAGPSALALLPIVALALLGNQAPFWGVGLAWVACFGAALWRPGAVPRGPEQAPPVWFLAFVGSHLLTTLLFGGVRFHWPLDPALMLIGLLGAFWTVSALVRRGDASSLALSVALAGGLLFRLVPGYLSEGLVGLRRIWPALANLLGLAP